ncbi:uncharacterized protein LOC129744129 [Uranotaenia lowii]|uniref:uncharacterized protein LOC129744129 n=1 Tax=Uranotaenia lowii TaxID=190385 RepID=UPI002478E797|nr:uncharacterized protein LOC129744129 [Uranotaenia lowii]
MLNNIQLLDSVSNGMSTATSSIAKANIINCRNSDESQPPIRNDSRNSYGPEYEISLATKNRKRERDWDKRHGNNIMLTGHQSLLTWKNNNAPQSPVDLNNVCSPNSKPTANSRSWVGILNLDGGDVASTSKGFRKNITNDSNFWTNVFFPSTSSDMPSNTLSSQQDQNLQSDINSKYGSLLANSSTAAVGSAHVQHDVHSTSNSGYINKLKKIKNTINRNKDTDNVLNDASYSVRSSNRSHQSNNNGSLSDG